jgi:ABC-type phosphate transport system substrate-binding protein
MRTTLRMRQLALTALCAGGTIGAASLIEMPAAASAATTTYNCVNLYGSGSTLQTKIQQQVYTADAGADGAFTVPLDCTSTPSVFYNTDSAGDAQGGSGSAAGLTEFALQAPAGGGAAAITPTSSNNGSFLDGFIGTDDPPSATAMSTAASAADSDPEPVTVVDAPIAIVVNLPAGCTVKASPLITNTDLAEAFANDSSDGDTINWTTLLKDAGAGPSGCGTTSPIVQVRSDGSGTSFATKQYLSQIQPSEFGSFVDDGTDWPGTVQTTYDGGTADHGSGGEAAAVVNTVGSIGYVNTADAAAAGFNHWTAGSSTFWVRLQNNGTSNSGTLTGTNPVNATTSAAQCSAVYTGAVPSTTTDEPDWTGVHVANPRQSASTSYPLCTLTYDVAWSAYKASTVLAPDYTAKYAGETAGGVGHTVRDYLQWVVGSASGKGQTVIPEYYNALPTKIDSVAKIIVSDYVAGS